MEFSKVTNFFSDLLGNPLSTPVGQLIEKATDVTQASEDWSLYMEICDQISSTEEGPHDAIRAVRKLISNNIGKSNTIIMYTLTVLETCVKNCGKRFHVHVAEKEFLQELVKLAMPRNNPPHFVLDKVLGLIQTWADAFRDDPDLKEFAVVYHELKEKGCEFPMTDLDNIAPIHTPARTVPEVQKPKPKPAQPVASSNPPSVRLPPDGTEDLPSAGPVVLTTDQLGKLHSELDVVECNCTILSDLLTQASPNDDLKPDDSQLMQELNVACVEMQKRIVDLIGRVQNEEVTGELLRINDLLNNVELRYQRYERMRTGQSTGLTDERQIADGSAQKQMAVGSDSGQMATLVDLGADTSAVHSQPTSVPPPGGGRLEDEEFDMFAQSRESFQKNLPTANNGNYRNQSEDQATVGLATAVTLKSKGATYKEEDIDEMEQWLSASELSEASTRKTTATSSEFDSFLATKEATSGNNPSATSDPTGEQRSNARGGRSLQKSEEEQALFSL